jgi:hypothetical protein
MKLSHAVSVVLLAHLVRGHSCVAAGTNAATPQTARSSERYAVDVARFEWTDARRDRKVPVKIYFPKDATSACPVIVFSHGLGGSRENYEYLGHHWAACGYVSVHVQHLGSDNSVWQDARPREAMGRMRAAAANLANATNRPADISFVIDRLEEENKSGSVLKQRLDLARIGVAGHSFGAFTTLAIAGEVFVTPAGRKATVVDPRVKAVIPMSSPVPKNAARFDEAFGSVQIPCFHMTGTRDASPIGDTSPEERRVPFDHNHALNQFLLTFTDGDHMIFSGRGRLFESGAEKEKDKDFQRLICVGSTTFWDAYLKDDVAARAWFTGGGFQAAVGDAGKFEMRIAPGKSSPSPGAGMKRQ